MRSFARSFNGGELTPEFYGQISDLKFQTGLALCRNFIVLPHGPVQSRAGFEFVREVKDSTKQVRLIPFEFSTTQTMVLEMGDQYVRFHTQGQTLLNGAAPYEVPSQFFATDLYTIRYVQSADVMTFVSVLYPPVELRRLGPLSWLFGSIGFAPTILPPINTAITAQLGNTPTSPKTYAYVVTALSAANNDESVISTPAARLSPTATITAITQAAPGVVTTASAHGLAIGDLVQISSVAGMTQINGGGYAVASVPTTSTLTLSLQGVPLSTLAFGAYTSGGVVTLLGAKNNLLDTGASNTITWSAQSGAVRYNVYSLSNGLWGYVGQTSGLSFTDNNIVPDISKTPPEAANPFIGAGSYPGAVTYFEQRRCFAGTINKPQNLWLTKSGTESNLTYSIPTRDSDSIAFRVAGRQANTIQHLVPLNNLLALTSSAEWRVSSINTDALTPSSISVKPQSYIGCNAAQPAIVNNNVIYAAARGGHLREMAFNWQAGGYLTGDLSLRAPHLVDGKAIIDLAFSKAPYPIVWALLADGGLLGLTYVPEQQIGAWHRHDTDGVIESMCVVAEGDTDVLYVAVRRSINGVQKRYVERLRPRNWATQADAFHVDCGATYSGPPTTTISNLMFLEGKTVNILADGAVHRQLVVTNGRVVLDVAASKVQIGLPIIADLQTLPMAFDAPGMGQGSKKNVNKVYVRVEKSGGFRLGQGFSAAELIESKIRTTEAYGQPTNWQSREVEVFARNAWNDTAVVCIRQQDPVPLTVVALTIDYASSN